jgi:hypothetical protein
MRAEPKEIEPCYLRVSGEENPSLEAMNSAVCNEPKGFELSFQYATEKSAAKEMGISPRGALKVKLNYCQESPALSKSFVLKGKSSDQRLCVEGTYFPLANKYGKLVVQKNGAPKEGDDRNE